jgi:hypothetical protein
MGQLGFFLRGEETRWIVFGIRPAEEDEFLAGPRGKAGREHNL